MYCPNCKKEFEDGVASCPDCNISLVKEIRDFEIVAAMKPVKVFSAANAVEADLVLNLLRNNGIPCFKKDNGSGSYMNLRLGFSVYGEEIYVDEGDYETASEMINSFTDSKNIDENQLEIQKAEDDTYKNYAFYKNPHILVRIYLLFMLGLGLLYFVLERIIH